MALPSGVKPAMFGLSNALLTCASIVVAVIVGIAGHLHDIRTPLVILILGTVAVAFYVPRAFAD